VPTLAKFIDPMLLLRKEKLPDSPDWTYEIKFADQGMMFHTSESTANAASRSDARKTRGLGSLRWRF
jgi:hypothetical protein